MALAVGIGSLSAAGAASASDEPAAAALQMEYTCGGTYGSGSGAFSATWGVDLPSVMYVGDPAVPVATTNTIMKWPGDETSSLWWLGSRHATATITPTVSLNGASITGGVLTSDSGKIVNGNRLTLMFGGTLLTIPAQDTPGDLNVGISEFAMPTEDRYSNISGQPGGLVTLSTLNYACEAQTGEGSLGVVTVKSRSDVQLDAFPSAGAYPGAAGVMRATVSVDGGTPAGQVIFTVNGQDYPADVAADGRAVAPVPAGLAPGNHAVTAHFVPADPRHYDASASPAASLKVLAPIASTTSVNLSPASVAAGTQGEATVVVSATEGPAPTGRVALRVGDFTTEATLTEGAATITLPVLPMGRHTVSVDYLPGSGFTASSGTAQLRVLGRSTTVLNPPATVQDTVRPTLTATVTADGGDTAGTVTFHVAGEAYQANVVDGAASVTLPDPLPLGDYTVNAQFTPAEGIDVAGSTSDGVNLKVTGQPVDPVDPVDPVEGPKVTATKVSVDQTSITYGQRPTVSAVVGQNATGTVVFKVGNVTRNVAVRGGVASTVLPVLHAGKHRVTATFVPADPTAWKSSTATTQVSVGRDVVVASVKAKFKPKKKLVRAKVRVVARYRGEVNGTAKVVLKGKGVKKKVRKVKIVNGFAILRFKKVRTPKFAVVVRYLGNADTGAAKAKIKVRGGAK